MKYTECPNRIDGYTGNGIGGVIKVNECTITTTGYRNCNCLCIIDNGDCPLGCEKQMTNLKPITHAEVVELFRKSEIKPSDELKAMLSIFKNDLDEIIKRYGRDKYLSKQHLIDRLSNLSKEWTKKWKLK